MRPPPLILAGQGLWGGRLLVFDSLPSTNQWALDHAATCLHGDVIRAIAQTAGRGRFDRLWLSPGRQELTISICLRMDTVPPDHATLLGPAAALAVQAAVQAMGVPALVKWPNDVLAGQRKLAGILVETAARRDIMVVGIGVNTNLQATDFEDQALRGRVTSIRMESGQRSDPDAVFARLHPLLATWLAHAQAGRRQTLQEAWATHDGLKGLRLRVTTSEHACEGQYEGLTETGALRLRDDAGTLHTLFSGDVAALEVHR